MARKARQSPQDESTRSVPMVVTSIRIPPSMREALVALAVKDGTTANQQVLWALEKWIDGAPRRASRKA